MTAPQAGTDTRGRIMEAALGLIADRGMTGVTMKAVATAAGISRQTLYNHYADVDGIVTDSLQAHQQGYLAELRSVLATVESPRARLEQLVRHSGATAVRHQPVGGLGHALSSTTRAVLEAHDRQLAAIIEDVLAAGSEAGEFRDDLDVGRDAYLVLCILNATTDLVAREPERVHHIIATATRTLLAAILGPKA